MWRKFEFCNTAMEQGTTNASRRCGKFWKLCWINTHVLCNVQILKSAVFAVSQYFATKKLLGGIGPLSPRAVTPSSRSLSWLRSCPVAGSRCRQQLSLPRIPHPSPRLRCSGDGDCRKKHKHVFMPRPAAATLSWSDDAHRRPCGKMYCYLNLRGSMNKNM